MTGGGICAHPPSFPTRFACAENGVGVKQIPQTNFPGRIPVVCVPNPRLWFASAYSSRVSVSSSCGVFQPRSRWDFLSDQDEEGAAGFPAGCDLSLGWMEVSLSLLPHTRPVLNLVFLGSSRRNGNGLLCCSHREHGDIRALFPRRERELGHISRV